MKNKHRSLAFLSALASLLPILGLAPVPFAGLAMADEAPANETEEEKKKRLEKEKTDADEAAKKQKAEDDEKKKKDDEEAAAKAKAQKPGAASRLSAALAGLAGTLPAQAAADLSAARAQVTTLTADLGTANAKVTTLTADLATARASLSGVFSVLDFFGIKAADVAGKSSAEVDTLLTAKISAAATAQITGMGLNPTKLPAPGGAEGSQSIAEIQAEMATTKDPVRLGQLAARANALRDGKPAKATV